MAFDWMEFFYLAQSLARQAGQASRRSAISRAYYAVFGIARRAKRLPPVKGSKVHRALIDLFLESSAPAEQQVGKILDQLRNMRNEADYEASREFSTKDVRRALRRAELALKKLGAL